MSDLYLSNLINCKYARCKAKREMTWWDLILKEIWWFASILTRSNILVILSRDTFSQLWIKLHRNQSNLLFIWSSIHSNWSSWDDWITLKSLRKEVLKFASNAEMLAISCMIEMQLHREVENSKNRFLRI
jgi:hypothetical protein